MTYYGCHQYGWSTQPTQWHTQPHHVQDAFPPASSYVYSAEDVSQAHAYHIHQSYNNDRFFSPLEQYRHEEYSPSYSPTAPSYHSHIHAPIPISSYSTLLPHLENGLSECSSTLRQKDFDIYSAHDSASLSPSTSTSSQSRSLSPSEDVRPLETYNLAPPSQNFFPPPCELLATLAETDCLNTRPRHRTPSLPSYSKTRSASCGDIGGTGAPPSTRAQSSKGGKVRSSTSNACLKSSAVVRRSQRAASMSFVPDSQQKTRPENIRKVFFRTVQKFVGFKPTDPDTITSHEKKRQYLEALEEYVVWLHDYCDSIRYTPTPLVRVDCYRELSSRSIRAMLVHYQTDAKCLYDELKGRNPECTLFEDN